VEPVSHRRRELQRRESHHYARAWSEDPRQVGEFTAAFIRSSAATGILTTAKHFPGHGDTSTDSHLDVARVSGDMERLQSTELVPFDAAIRAGSMP